jgi:hypothetical protein
MSAHDPLLVAVEDELLLGAVGLPPELAALLVAQQGSDINLIQRESKAQRVQWLSWSESGSTSWCWDKSASGSSVHIMPSSLSEDGGPGKMVDTSYSLSGGFVCARSQTWI